MLALSQPKSQLINSRCKHSIAKSQPAQLNAQPPHPHHTAHARCACSRELLGRCNAHPGGGIQTRDVWLSGQQLVRDCRQNCTPRAVIMQLHNATNPPHRLACPATDVVATAGWRPSNRTNSSSRKDVAVKLTATSFSSRKLQATVDINAPVPVVWEALTDYDNLGTFIPSLAENRCLERRKQGCLLYQVRRGVGSCRRTRLPAAAAVQTRSIAQSSSMPAAHPRSVCQRCQPACASSLNGYIAGHGLFGFSGWVCRHSLSQEAGCQTPWRAMHGAHKPNTQFALPSTRSQPGGAATAAVAAAAVSGTQVGAQDVAMGLKFSAACTLEIKEYPDGIPTRLTTQHGDYGRYFPSPQPPTGGALSSSSSSSSFNSSGASTSSVSSYSSMDSMSSMSSMDEASTSGAQDISFNLVAGDFQVRGAVLVWRGVVWRSVRGQHKQRGDCRGPSWSEAWSHSI